MHMLQNALQKIRGADHISFDWKLPVPPVSCLISAIPRPLSSTLFALRGPADLGRGGRRFDVGVVLSAVV
jgi:hypothetical protein